MPRRPALRLHQSLTRLQSLFGRSAGQPGTSKVRSRAARLRLTRAQERLEQIKVEVSNQLALANAQELVNVRRDGREPTLTCARLSRTNATRLA